MLVGLGGVTVEADERRGAADASGRRRHRPANMLRSLRGAPLLAEFRGRPARDTDAIVRAMVGLSQLFLDHRPWLSDLEINPLIVLGSNEGARAVDVRGDAAQRIGADRMDAVPVGDGLNFELPEEIRMLKDTVRKFVDRELIPIERTARINNKLKPEVRAHLTAKAKELGLAGYDVPQEVRRARHGADRQGHGWAELGRTIALPSRGVDVFGPSVSPILYHPQRRAEEKVPAADHPRRAELVPRPDRARRRRRPRRHAHHRGASGRSLRHQRHQALHHRRRRRALTRS
jgi:hypothetical protein